MHALIWLVPITFLAATLNGILGHGFSTLTVPMALAFLANRLLNPVLVLLEVVLNLGAFFSARRDFPAIAPQVRPLALWLLPGVLVGSAVVATLSAPSMKLLTFALLLPLVLLQAVGLRWEAKRNLTAPTGLTIGAIYAATTISGPLLSLYFHNLRVARPTYRAGISFLRVVESLLTAGVYLALGLFTRQALVLAAALLLPVLAGLALGAWLSWRIPEGAFAHGCVLFNTFAVAFGLTRLLQLRAPNPWLHLLWILPTTAVALMRGLGLRRDLEALDLLPEERAA